MSSAELPSSSSRRSRSTCRAVDATSALCEIPLAVEISRSRYLFRFAGSISSRSSATDRRVPSIVSRQIRAEAAVVSPSARVRSETCKSVGRGQEAVPVGGMSAAPAAAAGHPRHAHPNVRSRRSSPGLLLCFHSATISAVPHSAPAPQAAERVAVWQWIRFSAPTASKMTGCVWLAGGQGDPWLSRPVIRT
jgi:hypothetical protein